jgi:hypothetical protein
MRKMGVRVWVCLDKEVEALKAHVIVRLGALFGTDPTAGDGKSVRFGGVSKKLL